MKYEGYPDSRRFSSKAVDGQRCFVYDFRFSSNLATEVGAWMKRSAHWGGHGTALRSNSVVVALDKPLFRCTEKLPYVTRLVAIIVCHVKLRDEECTAHSLNDAAFLW